MTNTADLILGVQQERERVLRLARLYLTRMNSERHIRTVIDLVAELIDDIESGTEQIPGTY